MPNFTVVLIHIIGCETCRINPELAKALESYKYWIHGDDVFSFTTVETFKQIIAKEVAAIHVNDGSFV